MEEVVEKGVIIQFVRTTNKPENGCTHSPWKFACDIWKSYHDNITHNLLN